MKQLHLLSFDGMPILEQLRIEEALLRTDERSFCIINRGSTPAIVMGISGHFDELIHLENLKNCPMEVLRRYSGGGTVVVDANTLFVSFILNQDLLNTPLYPEKILQWSERFYQSVFKREDFHLIENDYVFGKKKFGGNAQYIKKERFVHHTTFLWDYEASRMQTLAMPKKRPQYRENRGHEEFVCKLKDLYSSLDEVIHAIKRELPSILPLATLSMNELEEIRQRSHRMATEVIQWDQ